KFKVEGLLVKGAPNRLTSNTLHGFDARLAAVSLLGQRLDEFQSVEAIGIRRRKADRDNFTKSRTAFDIGRRTPPGAGQGRSSHERDVQLAGRLVNVVSIRPVVGEMLVNKDGHDAASGSKDLECLLPEPAFGI